MLYGLVPSLSSRELGKPRHYRHNAWLNISYRYGGIGYAFATTFAAKKMKLALIDNSSEHLSKAVSELQSQIQNKDDIISITADVGNWDEIHNAAKTVYDKFGKVNVLCLNAGTSGAGAKLWTFGNCTGAD